MKLTAIHPKLPMRNKTLTKDFYLHKLGFSLCGTADYEGYLMLKKDDIEIHFLNSKNFHPKIIMVWFIYVQTILIVCMNLFKKITLRFIPMVNLR